MRGWKRFFYYLLINVFVSACVTVLVLQAWALSQSGAPAGGTALPVGSIPASQVFSPTALAERTVIVTTIITVIPTQATPFPTRGIVSYTVRAGDTLGGIALLFDVSVDALLELNSLRDPDAIFEGQSLLIPPPPTPTDTPAPVSAATLTLTPGNTPAPRPSQTPAQSATPSLAAAAPQVIIVGVFGPGALNTERVELQLSGSGEVALLGWQLVDEDGNAFTFPMLTLRAGASVNVYSRTGRDTVNALFWNREQPIWESGERATLLDAAGNVAAVFDVP